MIGIAKPIPSTPVLATFKVFIPITWPWLLTKAPPLLPELIAASVWIQVYVVFPSLSCTFLFKALTTPQVIEVPKSNGLPTAIANSPTFTLSESANSAAVRPVLSIFKTAKSVWESLPIIWASYCVSSPYNETFIEVASDIS